MNYYLYTIKTCVRYINRYPMYWFWMSVRAIFVVSETALPIILGHVINLLTQEGPNWEKISLWIFLYIGLSLINPFLEIYTGYQAWSKASRIGRDFRLDTMKLLKYAGLAFWNGKEKGGVMKVVDRSFSHFTELTANISHLYLWWGGRVIGIIVASAFIDPVIVLIYAVDMVLFVANLWYMIPKEEKKGVVEYKAEEDVTSRIMEYLNNFRTVVYINLFGRQEKEIKYYNDVSYDTYLTREKTTNWKWFFNNQLHAFSAVVTFAYGLHQIFQGNFEVGTLATLMIFSRSFSENIGALVWQSEWIVQFVNSMRRWHETFGAIKEDPQLLVPTKDITFNTLELKNVSVNRSERETLTDVSFQVKKGEKVAIVGYTGSGKSTMLDIILKALTEYKGIVSINDYDYNDLKVVDITNIFSIVPQEVQLFRDSVKGNILASNEEYNKPLDELLRVCSLTELVAKLPNGVEEPISEGSTNISGGERQRIGIARALVEEQPVLVLDEATASLDPKTERDVVTNIINTYPDLTLIYITHKYSLLNSFDHILVVSDGKIVEEGDFETLKGKGGLFKDLFEASKVD